MAKAEYDVTIEPTAFGQLMIDFVRCMCAIAETLHAMGVDITGSVETFGYRVLNHVAERHMQVNE
jgi:hypothetical protein